MGTHLQEIKPVVRETFLVFFFDVCLRMFNPLMTDHEENPKQNDSSLSVSSFEN